MSLVFFVKSKENKNNKHKITGHSVLSQLFELFFFPLHNLSDKRKQNPEIEFFFLIFLHRSEFIFPKCTLHQHITKMLTRDKKETKITRKKKEKLLVVQETL